MRYSICSSLALLWLSFTVFACSDEVREGDEPSCDAGCVVCCRGSESACAECTSEGLVCPDGFTEGGDCVGFDLDVEEEVGEVGSDAEECTPETMCYADFPCFLKSGCVVGEPQLVMDNHDLSCEEVCGTPCCEGGACDFQTITCEEGSVCAFTDADPVAFSPGYPYSDEHRASCVLESEACGGPDSRSCAEGQYCEYAGLLCPEDATSPLQCVNYTEVGRVDMCLYASEGGHGICQPRPSSEECASAPSDEVCGCDGVTYDSDCDRQRAGAVFAFGGACAGE